jgi:hypothetical protein
VPSSPTLTFHSVITPEVGAATGRGLPAPWPVEISLPPKNPVAPQPLPNSVAAEACYTPAKAQTAKAAVRIKHTRFFIFSP